MNRGPRKGTRTATDFVAKATTAWGHDIPEWVVVLAMEANRTTGELAAARVGYSPAVISQILGNTYRGDVDRVEQKVRGALMGHQVDCPVLGEIGKDICIEQQAKPFSSASSMRVRLFHACKTCPNRRDADEQQDL
jgi:hypothetical protein